MVRICGIIGCVINKNSTEIIRILYDVFINQKNRGMQGAGISIANGGDLFRFRSLSPFRLFNAYNQDVWARFGDGCRVLLHHRFPTSTVNEVRFNHPIANEKGDIHLIHNGVLYNDKELYKKLKHKHTFETLNDKKDKFTDTEVMVHLFEDSYKGNPENVLKALKDVYDKTSGSFAVALHIKGDKNIYLIKHSYSIIISKDKDGNFYFSSELDKDYKRLKKVHEMVEGEIGMLNMEGYTKLVIVKSKPTETVSYGSYNGSYNNHDLTWYGWSGQTKWKSKDSKKESKDKVVWTLTDEITQKKNPKKLRLGDNILYQCPDCDNRIFQFDRFHSYEKRYVIICGHCQTKVYFSKKELREVLQGSDGR